MYWNLIGSGAGFMSDNITMVGQELREVWVLALLSTLMDSYAQVVSSMT